MSEKDRKDELKKILEGTLGRLESKGDKDVDVEFIRRNMDKAIRAMEEFEHLCTLVLKALYYFEKDGKAGVPEEMMDFGIKFTLQARDWDEKMAEMLVSFKAAMESMELAQVKDGVWVFMDNGRKIVALNRLKAEMEEHLRGLGLDPDIVSRDKDEAEDEEDEKSEAKQPEFTGFQSLKSLGLMGPSSN